MNSRDRRAFIDWPRRSWLYDLGGGRMNATTLRGMVESVSRVVEIEPVFDDSARPPGPVPFQVRL